MKKYPIDSQFKSIANMRVPIYRPFAKPVQKSMRMLPCFSTKTVKVRHITIPGPDGNDIPTLVFTPRRKARSARPCLVYYHGGGFIFPAMTYQFDLARAYAEKADCVVVFPDYRLAPEFPYPAAADDCYAAYHWVLDHNEELRIDRGRIAVGGDSAGGNLTAVVTLMARDRGLKMPCFQMLIYPVTDRRMQTPSTFAYENSPVWSGRQSKKMWKFYLPTLPKEHLEYASPMEAPSLSGLPSAYLEVADVDSLRDEGLAYGEKLKSDGVKVEFFRTVGTPHGFEMVQKSQITQDAINKRCDALRRAFGG